RRARLAGTSERAFRLVARRGRIARHGGATARFARTTREGHLFLVAAGALNQQDGTNSLRPQAYGWAAHVAYAPRQESGARQTRRWLGFAPALGTLFGGPRLCLGLCSCACAYAWDSAAARDDPPARGLSSARVRTQLCSRPDFFPPSIAASSASRCSAALSL